MAENLRGTPLADIRLTAREQVYLWRKRHGLRQEDLAKRLGIHPDTLGERERGQDGPIGGLPGGIARLRPTGPEACVVMRRRRGWTQKLLAAKMGVSRHIVMAWERGEWDWRREAKVLGIR